MSRKNSWPELIKVLNCGWVGMEWPICSYLKWIHWTYFSLNLFFTIWLIYSVAISFRWKSDRRPDHECLVAFLGKNNNEVLVKEMTKEMTGTETVTIFIVFQHPVTYTEATSHSLHIILQWTAEEISMIQAPVLRDTESISGYLLSWS